MVVGLLLSTAVLLPSAASAATGAAPAACDLRQAVTAGHEVEALRTASGRVFEHPCGGMVATISAQPESFKAADGRWKDIDNSLEKAGPGYRNRASSTDVRLPATTGDSTSITRDGRQVAFKLEGAESVPASIESAKATYKNAFAGTDVIYEAVEGGVKEDIVLADERAPLSYSYRLKLSKGLSAQLQGDRSVQIEQADGRVVAGVAAPFMLDSAKSAARSGAVDVTLRREGDEYVLRLTADADWVRRHLKRGPVTIDPTVFFTPADPDCEIANASLADTNLCSSSTLGVGVAAGTLAKRRALLRFTIRRFLPKGATIFNAELSAVTATAPSTPTRVDVLDATRKWDYSATWNKWSVSNGSAWTTPGGDYNATPVSTNTQVGDRVGDREFWNVKAAVQRWADSGDTNGGNGLLLKQTDESLAQGAVEFSSSETANKPGLAIWYDNMTGSMPYYSFAQQQKLTDRVSMGVNVAGGNLLLTQRDLSIAGTGQNFDLTRSYNSREAVTAANGWGWTTNLSRDVHVWQSGTGDAQFEGPSNYMVEFKRRSDGTFAKPANLDADLVKNADGTVVITFRDSGQKLRFNTAGNVVEQADRNANKITVAYSGEEVASYTDTQGRAITATTTNGRVTKLTDPTGRSVSYGYSTDNLYATTVTDADGKITAFEYTGDQLTAVKDPRGNRTVFTYDDDRRITSVTRAGAKTSYTYGQAVTGCPSDLNTVVTDPKGNATTYCWEKPGRVTKVTDANGNTRSVSYNASSKVLTQAAAGGPSASNTYDSTTGNLTGATKPAGESSALAYGDPVNPYKATQSTNPQGTKTNFAYDAKGNTTSVRDGASPTATQAALEYNGQSGGVCPASGPSGTLRCAIDAKFNQTRYGYDAKGNLTSITPPTPLGQSTRTYDALSRLKTVTDANAKTRTYTYDAMDRVIKVDFSNGNTVAYTYDPNGNLTSRVDSAAGTTTYAYDAANNRTKDTLAGGATTAYTYDANFNLTDLTDRTGTVSYGYDKVNNLASITEPDAAKTTFGYDTRDNRITTTFPNGVVETRTYDASDKVLSIRAVKGTDAPLTAYTYSYIDASSRATELQQSVLDKDGETAKYSYDGLDRLTRELKTSSASAVISDRGYAYDNAGNRTTATNGTATTSYAYNAANQLCWKLDAASTAACASPPGGALTYTYDPEGNVTGASNTSALTYNARNQTATIRDSANNTDTLTYAGTGQEELLSAGARGFQNNQLGIGVQDGGQYGRVDVVREPSGRLFSTLEVGRRHYFLTDSRDSVTALANTSGTSGGSFKYDPFGTLIANPGQNVMNYFYFEGAPRFKNGLYKFGARYYDPSIGRWTQTDPIDQAADLRQANRYVYVGDDPINLSDPTGNGIIGDAIDTVAGAFVAGGSCVAAGFVPEPVTKVAAGAVCVGSTVQAARSAYKLGSNFRD